MSAAVAPRPQARSTAGWFVRDLRRALLVCGLAISACALAVYLASDPTVFRTPAPSGPSFSTGSLLLVAPVGNLCQERTIDNETWRIRGGAVVDCSVALARSENPDQRPGSRVDIIREGFRRGH
jgi:hypothetical protein